MSRVGRPGRCGGSLCPRCTCPERRAPSAKENQLVGARKGSVTARVKDLALDQANGASEEPPQSTVRLIYL